MIVTITDDFELEKIINSGQCFRPRKLSNGSFLFLKADKALFIKQLSLDSFEVSCDKKEWDEIWFSYFDLDRKYADIRASVPFFDELMKKSCIYGEGIRILRQDRWEILISFIISQRKSIPAIRSSVEKLCRKYGTRIVEVDDEEIYSFPTAKQMENATVEELSECGLGYRVSYIQDAVYKKLNGELDMDNIDALDDDCLFEKLKEIKGVGDKVANCVLLFGYNRTGRVPVDTWIQKVINERYKGENPFIVYGDAAGIMQQYVFAYVQNRKEI